MQTLVPIFLICIIPSIMIHLGISKAVCKPKETLHNFQCVEFSVAHVLAPHIFLSQMGYIVFSSCLLVSSSLAVVSPGLAIMACLVFIVLWTLVGLYNLGAIKKAFEKKFEKR